MAMTRLTVLIKDMPRAISGDDIPISRDIEMNSIKSAQLESFDSASESPHSGTLGMFLLTTLSMAFVAPKNAVETNWFPPLFKTDTRIRSSSDSNSEIVSVFTWAGVNLNDSDARSKRFMPKPLPEADAPWSGVHEEPRS